MKIAVIFGAGASFDSQRPTGKSIDQRWRPPLMKDLLSTENIGKISNYGFLNTLASRLRGEHVSSGGKFEEFLSKRYSDLKTNKFKEAGDSAFVRSLVDMIFYLQEFFGNCSRTYIKRTSNYHDLIGSLIDHYEDILFITFNYDCLLEKALEESCGYTYKSMSSYIEHPHKLIKPHGSCNWAYQLTNTRSFSQSNLAMLNAKELFLLLENLKVKDLSLSDTTSRRRTQMFPCMVLPINATAGVFKKDFVCPQEHTDHMTEMLNEADVILIIGWSGKEDHFGKILTKAYANKEKEIIVVDKAEDAIRANLSAYIPVKNVKFVKGGFSGALTGTELNNLIFQSD